MRVEVVTSFSSAGYLLYGKRCIKSYLAHWPFPLKAYLDAPMRLEGVTTRLNSQIPGWVYTSLHLPAYSSMAAKPDSYLWNARRYAVKPFIWHDAAKRMGKGILAWLDADTVTKASVPTRILEDMLGDAHVAYLGRGEMHPENGFVVFRVPEALPLLTWCRKAYSIHQYRSWPDGWTDCHTLRRGLETVKKVRARDLTSHAHSDWRSSVDAFALSPLGPYVIHLKGNRQKREGRLVTPEEMAAEAAAREEAKARRYEEFKARRREEANACA
jgi:hypothetical protein